MTVLRAMDGKFYDVPDEEAHKFEVPRDKVKELLAKAGGQPQGGPGPGGGGGRPTQHGGPTPPVVINVYAQGGPGGGAPGGGGPGGGGPGGAPHEGDVDPYWYQWWWNNWWGNY